MHICQFCNRECKNAGALATHSPYCPLNPERIKREKSPNAHRPKGIPSWSKGLRGDPRCSRKGLITGSSGRASTPEAEAQRKMKISEAAKGRNGGYREGSGRGKKGWYNGIFCDSSWELAYVLWCQDHGKHIIRNEKTYEYEYQGVFRNYLPDFLVDGVLTEIKGYYTEQFEAKRKAIANLMVLGKKEIEPILEYVTKKYGKDFIRLYEVKPVR